MITRINKDSISGTATNHRQRLGEVIRYLREERGHNHRMVSRTCAMPIATVEAMERGEYVPTGEQWNKMRRAVNHTLSHYHDLYRLACEERDAEQAEQAARKAATKETNVQNNGAPRHVPPTPSIGTNLGSKLATVQLQPLKPENPPPVAPASVQDQPMADKPKPDTTKLRAALANLPEGWKAREAIERRKAYALEQIRLRPGIRSSGADSLDTLLQRTFGVGLSDAAVRELRAQVERERIEAERQRIRTEVLAEVAAPAATPEPKPEPPPIIAVAPVVTREVNEADLAAAVELILSAVPGLESFTISVDAEGHASVDYQIRKVVITTAGGSLKVPRRG
jgi:hypothetical protein